MRKQEFYRRWKRRFLAGLVTVQSLLAECPRTGEAETIHDLRVALRRARILALVGRPVIGKTQATHFRQWALQVTAALSRVRDFDVMLEWLQIHSPVPKRDQLLRQKRARIWRLARPKLKALSKVGWKKLRRPDPSAGRKAKLQKRFVKEEARVRSALAQDTARFHQLDTAGLHQFRRGLRRLRYLRELLLSRRRQKGDRKLERLIAFQEALGEMQNCFVVGAFFSTDTRFKQRLEVVRLAKAQERQWFKRAEKHLAPFRCSVRPKA